MTPFCLRRGGEFQGRDVELLRDATTVVDALPDPLQGMKPWRCHEVARVVGELLGLRVVDCTYGAMDHSVLFIRDAHYPSGHCAVILDPYCPGRLPQVQLVYLFIGTPQAAMYKSAPKPRTDIREMQVKFLLKKVREVLPK